MDSEMQFRKLIHKIAEGLKKENLSMIRYLCKDAMQYNKEFTEALEFFNYFETKGWITPQEMSFLAELLYRINRHDLLKLLPGVKNRKNYEENFSEHHQNFKPFRIACFQLIDELTAFDFKKLKHFCRSQLSYRNFQKSNDITSLLVCLEEEDILSEDDLEFIIECLRQLDNQTPYTTFFRLQQGDFSIVLPKTHQHAPHSSSASSFHHSQSMSSASPRLPPAYSSYKSESNFENVHGSAMKHPELQRALSSAKEEPLKFFVGTPEGGEAKPSSFTQNSSSSFRTNTTANVNNQMLSGNSGPTIDLSSSDERCSAPNLNEDTTVVKDIAVEASTQCTSQNTNTLQPIIDSLTIRDPIADTEPSVDLSRTRIRLLGNVQSNISRREDRPESTLRAADNPVSQQSYGHSLPFNADDGQLLKMSSCSNNPETSKPSCLADDEKLEYYPMDSATAGICLIINNCNFNSPLQESLSASAGLGNRLGSDKDVENVSALFKRLRFDVKIEEDLDAKSMKKKLKEMSQTDHKGYDCFVLVIMSHGALGFVYGVDGEKVPFCNIKSYFKTDPCPTLKGKPKIVFVQACQMSENSKLSLQSNTDDLEQDGNYVDVSTPCSPDADFLFCYSTVPGCPAYRSKTRGSIFINVLVEMLNAHYEQQDLASIMVKVNHEMSKLKVEQISMPVSTLRGKIYFRDVK